MQFAVLIVSEKRNGEQPNKIQCRIREREGWDGVMETTDENIKAAAGVEYGIFVKFDPDFHFLSRSFSISYANQ